MHVPQVVMSATLDAAAFTRYFGGAQAAFIQVSRRTVPQEKSSSCCKRRAEARLPLQGQ